jgi:polyhydroxybutyrate depolymerase
MSYRLACERPENFRAIAAVTASLPINLTCQPDEPISVLVMNGTQDPLVPYEGGAISLFRREVGVVRPTAETVAFWVEKNGCAEKPEVHFEPDYDLRDQTRVRRESFQICDQGTEVVLYEVQGGGHTWPGSSQYLPEGIIGRVSQDINASHVIWDFFATQTKGWE